jgi:hypothetical protein
VCRAGAIVCQQSVQPSAEICDGFDNNCDGAVDGAAATCAAVPNGTPVCANSSCSIKTCNAGFADCDQAAANGCEISLNTDVLNCGACNRACPNGFFCSAGVCVNPVSERKQWH